LTTFLNVPYGLRVTRNFRELLYIENENFAERFTNFEKKHVDMEALCIRKSC